MKTEDLYELGDVTAAFRANAKPDTASFRALEELDIKVIRYKTKAQQDTKLAEFIGQVTEVGVYRIVLNGAGVADNLEMPRDVYHVLAGINIGFRDGFSCGRYGG